ncbi:MAG: hypothetical protein FJ104_03155 [Deltaproteobacteria bacterium]|nr:hypothetical protein [Deltaproteobacteria bacterium]
MNFLRRSAIAALLLGGSALSAAGCADNGSTLFIQGVITLRAPECVYKADPGGTFLGSGTLDVALRSTYTAGVLVGNQYQPRGDKENLRTETTRVLLKGAEITLTDSQGKEISCGEGCQGTFSVYGSGFANSADAREPGYGPFIAEVIPRAVGEWAAAQLGANRQARRTLVAEIRVFGETTGGQEIDSGAFTFPIEVCYGCLVSYPLAAMDLSVDPPTCSASVRDTPAASSCLLGQDTEVDCRLCSTSFAVCREPGPGL